VVAISQSSAADISLIQLAVAYVFSIWVSPLLSFYVHKTISPQHVGFKDYQPAFFWKILGYFERGVITASVAWGERLFFLIPIVFLPRFALLFFPEEKRFSPWELLLGSSMALVAGVWARTLR
jgi:hypothetical protein